MRPPRTNEWPQSYGFDIFGVGPCYVTNIQRDSVAYKSGLLAGDQILELDEQNVTRLTRKQLINLARHSTNQPPTLSVSNRLQRLNVGWDEGYGYGYTTRVTDPMTVDSVERYGPAWRAGLQPGDVIVEKQGEEGHHGTMVLSIIPMGRRVHPRTGASNDERSGRARQLYVKMKDVLGNDYKRNMLLVTSLKQYAEDRDLAVLCSALHHNLTPSHINQLYPHLRHFIPSNHASLFDHLMNQPANGKVSDDSGHYSSKEVTTNAQVRKVLQVNRDNGNFGFVLRGGCPVYIESIDPGGPADLGGLRPSDVIVKVNEVIVSQASHHEVVQLLHDSGNSPVLLVSRIDTIPDIPEIAHLSPTNNHKPTKSAKVRRHWKGSELRQQLDYLLTSTERNHLKQSLQNYSDSGDIITFMKTVLKILDCPSKQVLWHYIIPCLNRKHQLLLHEQLKSAQTAINSQQNHNHVMYLPEESEVQPPTDTYIGQPEATFPQHTDTHVRHDDINTTQGKHAVYKTKPKDLQYLDKSSYDPGAYDSRHKDPQRLYKSSYEHGAYDYRRNDSPNFDASRYNDRDIHKYTARADIHHGEHDDILERYSDTDDLENADATSSHSTDFSLNVVEMYSDTDDLENADATSSHSTDFSLNVVEMYPDTDDLENADATSGHSTDFSLIAEAAEGLKTVSQVVYENNGYADEEISSTMSSENHSPVDRMPPFRSRLYKKNHNKSSYVVSPKHLPKHTRLQKAYSSHTLYSPEHDDRTTRRRNSLDEAMILELHEARRVIAEAKEVIRGNKGKNDDVKSRYVTLIPIGQPNIEPQSHHALHVASSNHQPQPTIPASSDTDSEADDNVAEPHRVNATDARKAPMSHRVTTNDTRKASIQSQRAYSGVVAKCGDSTHLETTTYATLEDISAETYQSSRSQKKDLHYVTMSDQTLTSEIQNVDLHDVDGDGYYSDDVPDSDVYTGDITTPYINARADNYPGDKVETEIRNNNGNGHYYDTKSETEIRNKNGNGRFYDTTSEIYSTKSNEAKPYKTDIYHDDGNVDENSRTNVMKPLRIDVSEPHGNHGGRRVSIAQGHPNNADRRSSIAHKNPQFTHDNMSQPDTTQGYKTHHTARRVSIAQQRDTIQVNFGGNDDSFGHKKTHGETNGEERYKSVNGRTVLPIPDAPPPPPMPTVIKSPDFDTPMNIKRINWEKLDIENVDGTVWSKINGAQYLDDVLDQLELDQQFSTRPVNSIPQTIGTRPATVNSKKEISILSPKKAYNISILLAHLRLSVSQMKTCLYTMNETILTPQLLKQLITYAPDSSEWRQYSEYTGDRADLSLPDQFMMQMNEVEAYTDRLNALLFKANFSERTQEIKQNLQCVKRASEELHRSKKLTKIFELILAMGNHMNKGNSRVGDATAFKVHSLTQLDVTRTNDNKSTFLDLLIRAAGAKYPEVLDLAVDLPSVAQAARVSLEPISQELEELRKTLQDVSLRVESYHSRHLNDVDDDDRYYDVISSMTRDATTHLLSLLSLHTSTTDTFWAMTRYFGQHNHQTTTQQFFSIFAQFCLKFQKAAEQNGP